MNRILREAALLTIALMLLMSLLQTERLMYYYSSLFFFRVYFWVSVVLICICIFLLIKNIIRGQSMIPIIYQKFRSLRIPKAAKYVIVIVMTANFIAITLGKSWYPFYDVGMFRWSTPYQNRDKIMYQLKYYYWQNGQYKILDLRKEGNFFLADHFGLGYAENFMFSAAYRYRGEKKNFDFLSALMKQRGIDTLWVGIHAVNFETGEVSFDPDICRAIQMNETAHLYYGPIYIPDSQISKCHGY